MAIDSITIDPPMRDWPALMRKQPRGSAFGRPLEQWRRIVCNEYNTAEGMAIIATGHQPSLWHPGILAKYIAAREYARREHASVLEVTVSQDTIAPAVLDLPVRRKSGGSLAVRTFDLAIHPASGQQRDDVPVVAEPAFAIRAPALGADEYVDVHVREGLDRICAALNDGATQRNAAAQMMVALSRLMNECASLGRADQLMGSSMMMGEFGLAVLREMARDARRCAECYNAAVAAMPQARLSPLLIRDDLVELPLWRLHDDGRRLRANDSDVDAALEEIRTPPPQRRMRLMPRALTMTAMLRLAACDLFIHGAGGAVYDLAMERWIRDWLGVEVAPMAVVSATVRLPLMPEADWDALERGEMDAARNRKRQLIHDPETCAEAHSLHPGATKRAMLAEINRLPRRSRERRAAYLAMHQRLDELRNEQRDAIELARAEVARLESLAQNATTAGRRDWAFPLYPQAVLSDLAARIRAMSE